MKQRSRAQIRLILIAFAALLLLLALLLWQGIRRGDAVRLNPRLPASWEGFTLIYQVGRSRYRLTAARDVPYITLDGEKQVGAYVEIRDDGGEHEIRFPVN